MQFVRPFGDFRLKYQHITSPTKETVNVNGQVSRQIMQKMPYAGARQST